MSTAATITHKFVSGKADGADPTLVQPSKWNQNLNLGGGVNGQLVIRDTGQTDGVGTIPLTPPAVVLTPGASVAVDASLGVYFTLTAGQSFTLANPTNPTDAQKIVFRILQDGTGSRILTLDTKYRLGTDISSVVLTTTINKADYLGVVYNLVADKWDVIAFTKGY